MVCVEIQLENLNGLGWCLYLATGASLVRSDENAANMFCIYEVRVKRKDAKGVRVELSRSVATKCC